MVLIEIFCLLFELILFIFCFISIENYGNVSEVKQEVSDNNVCVDYNHESDESKNRYINQTSIEIWRKKLNSLASLHYHKKAVHSGNDNIDFEFHSNVLQQSTSTVESQLTLNVQKTSDDRLKCPIDGCEQVFKGEDSIASHVREHVIGSEDGQNNSINDCQKITDKCKEFNYQFSCKPKSYAFKSDSRRQMEMHKKSHYVCTYDGCRKEFSMELMLKQHINCFHKECTNKTVNLKFVCPIEGCDRVYNSKRNLNEHILTAHTKHNVICTHEGCDKTFPTEKIMKRHVFRVHEYVKVECGWPGCAYVGLKDTVRSHRLRHQNLHKPKRLVCNHDNCGQKFTSNDLLREHIHDVHNADKLLSCRRSGCTFQTYKSRELKRHYNNHQNWVSCDWPECGKMYKFKWYLEEHINAIHKNIKPHICPEPGCEYRTAYKHYLKVHVETHQDDQDRRKFPCSWPECTHVAKTNPDLKRHMVSHSDERPYACDWPGCDSRFKTNYQRNKHIETHSDEKNMVCDCGKRFKSKHSLWQHKTFHCHNK